MSATFSRILLWAICLLSACLLQPVLAQTPYCSVTYANGCAGNNGLSSVTINGVALSQNSGCSAGGYGQFTAVSTTVTTGQTSTFSLTLLDPNRPHGITIWADLNRNLLLDIGEDLFLSNGPLTGPISGTFTIPTGTAGGPVRLRVLSAYNTMPFWPCSTNNGSPVVYEAGETEDYTVHVLAPITNLTTTNITDQSAQLSWTGSATGVTYEVQYRLQGVQNWFPRFNVNSPTILSDLSAHTAYEWRVRQSGTVDFTEPVSFTTRCGPITSSITPTRTQARLDVGFTQFPITLRYRVAGTADWTSIANITISYSTTGSSFYSLTGLTPTTAYEYQVQRNCSSSDNSAFSDVGSFTTLSCSAPVSPYIQNLRSNSVSLNWGGYTEPGQRFRVQYRPVGSATWSTIDNITANSFSLTGITTNVPYEWQVQRVCSPTESSGFVSGPSFTLACPMPQLLSSPAATTSVFLSWQIDPTESNKTYDIQYRLQGTADWTTLSSLTTTGSVFNGYLLTGLTNQTAYEWRIRSICPTGVPSDFSPVKSFTTGCPTIFSAWTVGTSGTSAELRWNISSVSEPGTRFDLRYRPVGNPDWTTISSLTNIGGYLLTGLTNNTLYEWQVRVVCSPTESSSFANGENFTTNCRAPGVSSGQNGFSRVTSATITWTQAGPAVQYEVYYRPIGSANWATLSNVTTTSAVLAGLQSTTPYEWQVRTLCGSGVVSDFSEIRSFTTLACSIPVGFTLSVSDYVANLGWVSYTADADTRFEIRWRAVGAPDWTTVSNLTVNAISNGQYSLTGLTPGTAYEWQIRAQCSLNQLTDYSALLNFQTLPACNGVLYTIRHGDWFNPTTWSCNRVPLPTDVVQIGHNVFVSPNILGTALRIQFDGGGKLFYSGNSRLKLGL